MREGERDDPMLAEDVVGVSSARLLAAGVPAARRLYALRVLGVLGAVADRDLRVRRPPAAVAREFGLDARRAAIALDDLVAVGVVGRDADALVLGGAEPAPTGALRLHDFLALADGAAVEPAPRSRTVVVLRPAAAVLAAAALIAAVLLAPGALRQSPTPVSSNGDTAGASSASTPSTLPPDRHTSSGSTSRPGRPATVTPATGAPPGPVCPPGGPVLEVLGATPDISGNLSVAGVARNTTDRAIVIRSFAVRTAVGASPVSAPGTDAPLLLPPHSSVDWTATLPVAAPGTEIETVLGDWQWQGSDVPPGCPAP